MKRRTLITVLTVAIAAVIVVGAGMFATFVYGSLWDKSVTDTLEVTTQGQRAFDVFFEKDLDTLDLLAGELEMQESSDTGRIEEKIALFDGNDGSASYLCVNVSTGDVFRLEADGPKVLSEEDRLAVADKDGRGVIEPFLDEMTGVSMIGVYEKFTFADGVEGLVRKSRPLQEVADRFSLSFYGDSGFSYVVNDDGDIIVRSTHRNSNRTISNVYDIVESEGNDAGVISSFRSALEQGKRGVAQFTYLGQDYVFCYSPLETTDGWDIVSIIPSGVIMEQARVILQATFVLCAVIVAGLLLILVVYWRSSAAHRKEVERIAYFDTLTGLYSSDKFEIEGAKMLSAFRDRARRSSGGAATAGSVGGPGLAAVYFNIVDFKLINDVEGYQYGDEVLCGVADIMREASGEDGIACRATADHFIIMRPYKTVDDIVACCQKAIDQAKEITAAGKPLLLSAGVCCSEDAPEASVTELTDRARIAKTEGQKRSKELCVFNSSMRELMLRRAEIECIMDAALENNEFFPLVQPKFSTDGTSVLGGEALVRWSRPGGVVVGPDEFVPIFEQNGFIIKLDEFMFTAVCRSLRQRIDAGLPVVPVSVNVSRLHLHSREFVPTYVAIKNAYAIPDGLAELEFTETMVLEDLDHAIEVIDEFGKAGLRCSIDDFGSGQSSLNALKNLPVNVLKLDREFLFDRAASDKGKVVVRTVIDMAQRLEMETVMEGVETAEQLAFIQTTSCDMIQGFVFSKPLALEEFYRLVDEKRG